MQGALRRAAAPGGEEAQVADFEDGLCLEDDSFFDNGSLRLGQISPTTPPTHPFTRMIKVRFSVRFSVKCEEILQLSANLQMC